MLPPSVPTCLTNDPSYTSRNAAIASARVSVCIDRMVPKSFKARMPKSPICASSPPLASLALFFLDVPESRPAGVKLVACTTCGRPEVALRISVFAELGGAINDNQTASPSR